MLSRACNSYNCELLPYFNFLFSSYMIQTTCISTLLFPSGGKFVFYFFAEGCRLGSYE